MEKATGNYVPSNTWIASKEDIVIFQVGDNLITVEIVGEHLEVHGTRSLTLAPAYGNEIKVY